MTTTRAMDLQPGMLVDIPDHLVAGTDNENIAAHEYARVESVGGGWADGMANPDEVVIYTENFASPVVAPAVCPLLVV